MFKLRPYQEWLVSENERLWAEGLRNPCTVLSTGGGKTLVAAELIRRERDRGGYFAAVAHRQELVGQISLALARQGVMHDIIAPRSVVRFCSDLHVKEIGQSYYSTKAPGFVGGVDTVIRRDMGRLRDTVSLLFQDECFPAGTMVTTPDGQREIESLRIGDTVIAFNEQDGSYHERSIVRTFKNPMPDILVGLLTRDGAGFYTTMGHPIWVRGAGWTKAYLVNEGDQVLVGRSWEIVIHREVVKADLLLFTDMHVYNIEVDEFHTYIAGGVVVHNCHHVQADNKWGKAAKLFPRAKGLYVTATPCRADGKGLGRHADGLFDEFIIGPPMRQLIRDGNLTDYRIFAPPSDIDLTAMTYGKDGDFSPAELRKRARKSHIVGDTVTNYKLYADGMQCVVFAVDVQSAHEMADQFNVVGIPAIALSAKNTDHERQDALDKFRRREIRVIANVDILGEGFDCPGIEAVIFARPTASYGLYCQQFGRGLRPLPGKTHAVIIDMVGNVVRHGLPDAPREWSLGRREKRKGGSGDDAPAVKVCPECMSVYQVGPTACPFCGHRAIAAGGRGELIMVDAQLRELTAEELAEMRGEADKLVREWRVQPGMSKSQVMAVLSHNKTVGAQKRLRDTLALYAGAMRAAGLPDELIHIQLWKSYGTDVSSAQLLRPKDADELAGRIEKDLQTMGVYAG